MRDTKNVDQTPRNTIIGTRRPPAASPAGVDLDPTAKVLYIKLRPQNQPPTGTSATLIGHHNTHYVLKTSDFGFSDPNNNPPNTLLAVKIDMLPSAGTLKDNGVTVTVNQFVSATDIAAGKLIFTPTANLVGGPYFLMKFQVHDNGGTEGGGVDLDPNPKLLYIRLNN